MATFYLTSTRLAVVSLFSAPPPSPPTHTHTHTLPLSFLHREARFAVSTEPAKSWRKSYQSH